MLGPAPFQQAMHGCRRCGEHADQRRTFSARRWLASGFTSLVTFARRSKRSSPPGTTLSRPAKTGVCQANLAHLQLCMAQPDMVCLPKTLKP